MNGTHGTLDRLEKRVDDQAARIDALYEMLELRGVLPQGDDEERESPDLAPERPTKRPRCRLRVGTATGV